MRAQERKPNSCLFAANERSVEELGSHTGSSLIEPGFRATGKAGEVPIPPEAWAQAAVAMARCEPALLIVSDLSAPRLE